MTRHACRATLALLCLGLAALTLAVAAAPVQAANHPFLGVVANGDSQTRFEDACGVAADSRGNVYVSDFRHHAIDVFAFESTQSSPVPKYRTQIAGVAPLDGPCELAVDSAGRVYVNDYHQSVLRYTPNHFPFGFDDPPSYGAAVTIDSANATGVAVDPVSGVVYVAHRKYVAAYEPSGAPVLSAGEPLRIGLGSLGDANGLAVSGFAATGGHVYVADAGDDTVKVFDPATDPLDPLEVVDGAATPAGRFNDLADTDVAVDDSNGHFFVPDNLQSNFVNPVAVVNEFSPQGRYRGQLPHQLIDELPSGIAVDNSSGAGKSPVAGNVYALSADSEGPDNSVLYGFGPADIVPTQLLTVAKTGSSGGTVASAPAGLACGSACVGEFGKGSVVTLTATDDGHSAFKGWTVTGQPGACPGTGGCQLILGADTEVSAEFEALPQQSLTVAKAGSGSGTVATSPAGIDCGTTCAAEFNAGSTVTLSAVAEPHSAFRGWNVTGQPGACPGTGACELVLGAASAVVASFEALPERTLSVAKVGAGKGTVKSTPVGIDCGPSCVAAFDQGSTVTLVAAPASGSRFAGWSGGGCAGTGPCEVVLDADAGVTASFEPLEALPTPPVPWSGRTLAISVVGSGSGTIQSSPAGIDCGAPCAGIYPRGTVVTLTASASPESRFGGWSGCEAVQAYRCTVTLAASRTVVASFEEAAPLKLGSISGKGAKAFLEVTTPSPGVLSAAAEKLLRSAKVRARRAGTVALPLVLSKAGRKALERKGRLGVTVSVTFKPSDNGAAVVVTKKVNFKKSGSSKR